MLRKVTLALVAAASLSAMALAPTAASAKPWGGGWGGGWHHHHWVMASALASATSVAAMTAATRPAGCSPRTASCSAPSTSAPTDLNRSSFKTEAPVAQRGRGFLILWQLTNAKSSIDSGYSGATVARR